MANENRSGASFRELPHGTGPVPVRPVSTDVQLTPIIQPIALVPYSTQNQPLYTFGGQNEYVEAEPDFEEEAYVDVPAAPVKKKGPKAAPIFLIIFGLLIAAVMIIGKFAVSEYLAIVGKTAEGSGLGIIMDLVKNFTLSADLIVNYAVLLTAFFALVTIIASLIRICKKGACVVAKISTFFTLACSLVVVIMLLIDGNAGIGSYIIAGLSLVSLLIAYLAKNR